MKPLRLVFVAFITVITLSISTNFVALGQSGYGAIEVINQTNTPICSVYWTPSSQSEPSWSNLFEGITINPGETRQADSVILEGMYNFWIGDCQGNELYIEENRTIRGNALNSIYVVSSSSPSAPVTANDDDNDGLANDDELWLAQAFNPLITWDENEDVWQRYTTNAVTMLYQVTPNVQLPNGGACHALITYVILYPEDFGSTLEEVDFTFHAHPGDNESLRICAVHDANNNWSVYSVLIKRHYDEPIGYLATVDYMEQDTMNNDADMTIYYFGVTWAENAHINVWASEDKHGMYIFPDECEIYDTIPDGEFGGINYPETDFFRFEDCGDGIAKYLDIYPQHNVGERPNVSGYAYRPRFDLFSESGSSILDSLYGYECAWCNQPFCGSSSQPAPGRNNIDCAGSNTGKLWPPVTCPEGGGDCSIDNAKWQAQLAQLAWGH